MYITELSIKVFMTEEDNINDVYFDENGKVFNKKVKKSKK